MLIDHTRLILFVMIDHVEFIGSSISLLKIHQNISLVARDWGYNSNIWNISSCRACSIYEYISIFLLTYGVMVDFDYIYLFFTTSVNKWFTLSIKILVPNSKTFNSRKSYESSNHCWNHPYFYLIVNKYVNIRLFKK